MLLVSYLISPGLDLPRTHERDLLARFMKEMWYKAEVNAGW